jgi:Ribbon-helix-helix protein, copG family
MPTKFMQSLDPKVYAELRKIAKDRGITMQELIRAVIVPDWMSNDKGTGSITPPRRSRTVRSPSRKAPARIAA